MTGLDEVGVEVDVLTGSGARVVVAGTGLTAWVLSVVVAGTGTIVVVGTGTMVVVGTDTMVVVGTDTMVVAVWMKAPPGIETAAGVEVEG